MRTIIYIILLRQAEAHRGDKRTGTKYFLPSFSLSGMMLYFAEKQTHSRVTIVSVPAINSQKCGNGVASVHSCLGTSRYKGIQNHMQGKTPISPKQPSGPVINIISLQRGQEALGEFISSLTYAVMKCKYSRRCRKTNIHFTVTITAWSVLIVAVQRNEKSWKA